MTKIIVVFSFQLRSRNIDQFPTLIVLNECYLTMAHKAPKLERFSLETFSKFLKEHLEYEWDLADIKKRLSPGDQVLPSSMISCVDSDLLSHLCLMD